MQHSRYRHRSPCASPTYGATSSGAECPENRFVPVQATTLSAMGVGIKGWPRLTVGPAKHQVPLVMATGAIGALAANFKSLTPSPWKLGGPGNPGLAPPKGGREHGRHHG
jgi:hypothetical protein